jgi:diguanylate cyclase (GGDEF)-like protein
VSGGGWIALGTGVALGLIVARLIPLARRLRSPAPAAPPAEGPPRLPDVPDIVRQMLAVSGRRAMIPVILKLVDELLAPTQVALFASRPDGRLSLADGRGLPESMSRGFEVDSRPGAAAALPPLAGFVPDVVAPIMADQRLYGIIGVAGVRKQPEEAASMLKMVAELSGLAIVQVEKLKATQDRANIDGLTAVFNKRHFQERLTEEIERAQKDGTGLSLLLLDIDDFKNYNDTNGHVAGDDVLRDMGRLLRSSVREDDVVARYGGEEFVVLYPGASKALAYRLAQGLRRAVELHPFPGGDRQPLGAVTISGGVATFPQDATTEVELIQAADQALYEAKAAGRNRIIAAGNGTR